MSVVTLRKLATQPPDALLTSFRKPERSPDDDVVDLSALVARQSELSPSGFARVEIPLLGADGAITGVLCRNTGVGFPDNAPSRIERDAAQVPMTSAICWPSSTAACACSTSRPTPLTAP